MKRNVKYYWHIIIIYINIYNIVYTGSWENFGLKLGGTWWWWLSVSVEVEWPTRSSSSRWIKQQQRLHCSRSNQKWSNRQWLREFRLWLQGCISVNQCRAIYCAIWWAVYCCCCSIVMLQHCVSEENKEEENEYWIGSNLKCLMLIRFFF